MASKKKRFPNGIYVSLSDKVFSEIRALSENRSSSLSTIARQFIEAAIHNDKHESFRDEIITKEGK